MFTHYKTEGIIIKKENLRESDQLFTIYTKEFGKLEILGKAIRKIQSKLRSGADIFYLSELEFIQGKRYKILTEAQALEKFTVARKDLARLKILHKTCTLSDNLIRGQQKDPAVWQLLLDVFQIINDKQLNFEDKRWGIVYYYFIWNLLAHLGYKIELYYCSLCREKLIEVDLSYNHELSGIVCPVCFAKTKNSETIEADTIKILRVILNKSWPFLKKLKLREKDLSLLGYITNKYLIAVGLEA